MTDDGTGTQTAIYRFNRSLRHHLDCSPAR
jgi:hypothetical protein